MFNLTYASLKLNDESPREFVQASASVGGLATFGGIQLPAVNPVDLVVTYGPSNNLTLYSCLVSRLTDSLVWCFLDQKKVEEVEDNFFPGVFWWLHCQQCWAFPLSVLLHLGSTQFKAASLQGTPQLAVH